MTALLLSLALLPIHTSLSTCTSIPTTPDSFHRNLKHRDANDTSPSEIIPVLGLPGLGVSTTYPRLEIRELQRRADEFNVYLLGLREFQDTSQEDKLGYFQIAGIHGRPFIPWDGVQGREDPKEGYCAHSSNLFPTWHRPYLALIEERIYFHAQKAISEFPDGDFKNRMSAALLPLRLPYWDAAAVPPQGTGSFPWVVQREVIDIELPDGRVEIPNPLYSYTFDPVPTKDIFGKLPWTHWKTTKRYPADRSADTASQNGAIGWQLDSNMSNLRQRTYQMLAMQKEYQNISNNMVTSTLQGGVLDSLESVHDTIHNTVGNGGHLTNVAYSAFDPIFWLLHTNIDRMLAIWQALNPNSYVTSQPNMMATFTTPADSYADENTPLLPFHCNEQGDFWTSASVRDCNVFAYSYPELIGLPEDVSLVRRVNGLYGENATSQFSFKQGDPAPKNGYTLRKVQRLQDALRKQSFRQRGPYQYQYYANIHAQKTVADGTDAAGGAYKVFVFLGRTRQLQDSLTPMDWLRDPSFVGFTGFQSSSTLNYGGYSGNPADGDSKQQANGVVALTKALEERMQAGELQALDEKTVGEYLNREMSWRISTADHKYIHPNDAPGFEIEVSYARTKPPTPDTFPEVQDGGFKHLMYATSGKAGGVQDGDMGWP